MRKVSEEPPRPFRLKRGHVFWATRHGFKTMLFGEKVLGAGDWIVYTVYWDVVLYI